MAFLGGPSLIDGEYVPPPVVQPPPVAAAPPPPPTQTVDIVDIKASYVPQATPPPTVSTVVTPQMIADADAAAIYVTAGINALLAGGGSQQIADAEQGAGAPPEVVAALIGADIPDLTNLDVTSTNLDSGDDIDAAAAEALANNPDLSDLGTFDIIDPFGVRELSVANPSLRGGSAIAAIAQACSDYGVDALAAIADAIHEGASGGMGDGGLAYGPFQDHLTEFKGRPFYGKGRNNAIVNAWAWTDNGIRYSVRAMVNTTPSARGLHGHAAVYAIVYGYERPGDEAGAYKTRSKEYDKLIALGGGWASYAAPLFKGPSGGGTDTVPLVPVTATPVTTIGNWRSLIVALRDDVPAAATHMQNTARRLGKAVS